MQIEAYFKGVLQNSYGSMTYRVQMNIADDGAGNELKRMLGFMLKFMK